MNKKWKRIFGILVLGIAVFFLSCVILETAADARAGGGRSSGSRGFSSGSRSSGGTYNYNRSTPYQSTNPTQGPATPQKNTYSPGRGFLYGLGGGLADGLVLQEHRNRLATDSEGRHGEHADEDDAEKGQAALVRAAGKAVCEHVFPLWISGTRQCA